MPIGISPLAKHSVMISTAIPNDILALISQFVSDKDKHSLVCTAKLCYKTIKDDMIMVVSNILQESAKRLPHNESIIIVLENLSPNQLGQKRYFNARITQKERMLVFEIHHQQGDILDIQDEEEKYESVSSCTALIESMIQSSPNLKIQSYFLYSNLDNSQHHKLHDAMSFITSKRLQF